MLGPRALSHALGLAATVLLAACSIADGPLASPWTSSPADVCDIVAEAMRTFQESALLDRPAGVELGPVTEPTRPPGLPPTPDADRLARDPRLTPARYDAWLIDVTNDGLDDVMYRPAAGTGVCQSTYFQARVGPGYAPLRVRDFTSAGEAVRCFGATLTPVRVAGTVVLLEYEIDRDSGDASLEVWQLQPAAATRRCVIRRRAAAVLRPDGSDICHGVVPDIAPERLFGTPPAVRAVTVRELDGGVRTGCDQLFDRCGLVDIDNDGTAEVVEVTWSGRWGWSAHVHAATPDGYQELDRQARWSGFPEGRFQYFDVHGFRNRNYVVVRDAGRTAPYRVLLVQGHQVTPVGTIVVELHAQVTVERPPATR